MGISWVFLDVGGPLFSDASYFTALFNAIRERAPGTTREEFDARFAELRAAQSDSFSDALVASFVPDTDAHPIVRKRTDAAWERIGYGVDELFPDVNSTLEVIARRYRLACITNHFSWVRDRSVAAGFGKHVDVWAISAEVGAEKPDERIFKFALQRAGARPETVVMVGDRLDRDLVPAKRLGMRTVWVLRNEAPDDPTPEQLAIPDASIKSLEDLPDVLDKLDHE
ncbi:MAG: HAD family hydrolase [Actinomycetota bacterium]